MTTFYLGTHKGGWLRKASVPLFVSDRTLAAYRGPLPVAAASWALDSGGFTELQKYGGWTVPAEEYLARVVRYDREVGGMTFWAQQDWMCEPIIIAGGVDDDGNVYAGTGLDVAEHQRRTVANYLELRELASSLDLDLAGRLMPSVQGYAEAEYLECVDLYAANGVDLTALPLVGLGSVCRRQATSEALGIITALGWRGVRRMHGFGVKTTGLKKYGRLLASADSLAWSFAARRRKLKLDGCPHATCANCLTWATQWRADVIAALDASPPSLFDAA